MWIYKVLGALDSRRREDGGKRESVWVKEGRGGSEESRQ